MDHEIKSKRSRSKDSNNGVGREEGKDPCIDDEVFIQTRAKQAHISEAKDNMDDSMGDIYGFPEKDEDNSFDQLMNESCLA